MSIGTSVNNLSDEEKKRLIVELLNRVLGRRYKTYEEIRPVDLQSLKIARLIQQEIGDD